MALYIGKDSSNSRGIYHATAGDHTEEELKSGVLEDTLFHSDLPVVRTTVQYDLTRSHDEDWDADSFGEYTATYIERWDFPGQMILDVQAGYCFIGVATLANGAQMFINSTKFNTGSIFTALSSAQGGGKAEVNWYGVNNDPLGKQRLASLEFSFAKSQNIVTQYEDVYTDVSEGTVVALQNRWWKWYGIAFGGGGWLYNYNKYIPGNVEEQHYSRPPYMDSDTRALVIRKSKGRTQGDGSAPFTYVEDNFVGKVGGASVHETPEVTAVRFYRLEIKVNSSGYVAEPLPPQPKPGEFLIDKHNIEIGGTDILSGFKYLRFRGYYDDGAAFSLSHPTSEVIPANCISPLNEMDGYPHGSLPSRHEALNSDVLYVGALHSPRAVVMNGTTIECQAYGAATYTIGTRSSTVTFTPTEAFNKYNSVLSQHRLAAYEFAEIPNINQVEMTNNSLTINGDYDIYSNSVVPVSVISDTLQLNLVSGDRSITYEDGLVSVLEDYVELGSDLGPNLHILCGLSTVTQVNNTATWHWTRTNITASLTPPMSLEGVNGDQSPLLLSIPEGEQTKIGSQYVEAADFRGNPSRTGLMTMSMTLKYTNNRLELWTHAKFEANFGDGSGGTLTYNTPNITMNIVRLTSAL